VAVLRLDAHDARLDAGEQRRVAGHDAQLAGFARENDELWLGNCVFFVYCVYFGCV
jgi:hypothetical protein